MQRLPPAGWSRHHLIYPHRCVYCSPNLNPSEYTRPVSQLSGPPLPMPEPFHFPDPRNNSTKNKNLGKADSDQEFTSITINNDKSEKETEIKQEKSQEKSPMDNPPWWRRIYWCILTLLNIYTLVGSIALIVTFCARANPFESYQNAVSSYVIIIITALEFSPRTANIYHIHQYSKGKFGLCEVLAIMIGKKELYLLYGKTHLKQKQIDKMGYIEDALCLVYWIFLSYQIALEIQKNMGNSLEFIVFNDRGRLLMFTLLLTATLSVLRILWALLKKCVYFADK